MARRFLKLLEPDATDILLDCGGPGWGTKHYLAGVFYRIVAVNLGRGQLRRSDLLPLPTNFDLIEGDACALPLADRSVDYVLADNLIEHIPVTRWPTFAQEIRRVSRKGYMLIQPNYWFPIEKHYLMPLWQFMPQWMQKAVMNRFRVGWYPRGEHDTIYLPTPRKLRRLLPEGHVEGLGFLPLMWDALVAWHKVKGADA